MITHNEDCWKKHPKCADKRLRRCLVVQRHMERFVKIVEDHNANKYTPDENLRKAVEVMKKELVKKVDLKNLRLTVFANNLPIL